MGRCNITGVTDGELYDFYVNADFGYNARYLVDKRFEFSLCQNEYDMFMSLGIERISEDMSREDYANLNGLWFTSEQVYVLISTFQHPPKGYFCEGWLQLEDDEEQRLWDHMEFDSIEECFHLFSEDRIEEIKKILYIK